MRASICWLVFLGALLTSPACQAGGFFRRVPEVGEWARYELTSRTTYKVGEADESMHEDETYLLLKCVGEEMVNDQRHLWIEVSTEAQADLTYSIIVKLLVSEDSLLQGTVTEENTRGWNWYKFTIDDVTTEPAPLDFSESIVGGLFNEPTETTGQLAERTIVVNDVEVQLSYAETAQTEEQRQMRFDVETPDGSVDLEFPGEFRTVLREATWWPHEDLAFGVAAYDVASSQSTSTSSKSNESHYELVATGTDAVSDMPDHN